METDNGRQSPRSSPIASTSALARASASSLDAGVRAGSVSESRRSEDTALVSDSAFQTPDAGVSALSLPPLSSSSPTSARTREYDDSRQPGHLRDSGIDTSTSTNRISGRFSQSMPNLPPLMPPGEDRPDLWRTDLQPPTFRPRIQGGDPAAQLAAMDRLDALDTRNRTRPPPRGIRRIFAFLGYGTGNRYRKELVSLIWNLAFGFVQVSVTLALIIYSSVHRSRREPSISEWTACDKPLGLWSCFWIVKVFLDCGMTYWGWRRDWKDRQRRQNRPEGDAEQGASAPSVDAIAPVDTNMDPPGLGPMDRQRRRIENSSPHYRLYTRLSLLLSLIIISWFLTSNILVFTSLQTCRFTAPHLWWLVFSLLCLQYLVILEVLATAIIVFIIGPLIYLFWSIILICLGRHPIQNPHYFSPEIGKISKNAVDQIPLVLYIPSPPGDEKKGNGGTEGPDTVSKPETATMPKVGAEHTYPPKQPPTKRRFAFLSRKPSKAASNTDNEGKNTEAGEKAGETWEDCWESGDYPFVRLDPNRASCAICLLDFEEPKRRVAREVIRSWAQKNREGSRSGSKTSLVEGRKSQESEGKGEREGQAEDTRRTSNDDTAVASSSTQPASSSTLPRIRQESSQSSRTENDGDELSIRLEDAGEGAQPLRLLECGHAFHKTCIDPWLTDVSGRCPTCQRPVAPPDPPRKKRNRQGQQ